MQVVGEMAWTAFDFALMGALVGAVGLGLELVVRVSRDPAYRLAAGLALAAAVLLVLINGAVGVIGSEDVAANRLYLGVVAVALVGAIAARLRAAGMAWAMTAAAAAQLLVPFMAYALGWASLAQLLAPPVTGLTGVFTAVWLAAAWLFRRAAERVPG
jgi:hypothetical protein